MLEVDSCASGHAVIVHSPQTSMPLDDVFCLVSYCGQVHMYETVIQNLEDLSNLAGAGEDEVGVEIGCRPWSIVLSPRVQ